MRSSIPYVGNYWHTDAVKPLTFIVALAIAAWPATSSAQLRADVVLTGVSNLVGYIPDPVIPGVQYAVQQSGIVRVVQNGVLLSTPFLDIHSAISAGGEQGLLGLAFDPNASTNRVFVNFTNTSGHTVIARFRRSATNALVADPASRFDLRWPDGNRFITQPFANHNGGHLTFGPDGFLYIGLGDGGSGNDPNNNAQNPNSLLGKMLRIDVAVADADPVGYRIPSDNPFLDGVPIAALGEIWAFGLRNPWRYTFDDPARGGTGALFIADVGQSQREEINFEPAGGGGRNYGWRLREGTIATPSVPATTPAFLPLTDPLVDYPRSVGTTVTGGYVYRGQALGSEYVGRYFVADFGSARVFSLSWAPNATGGATVTGAVEHTAEFGDVGFISSFAVDQSGELYLVDLLGRVLKIVRDTPAPSAPSNLNTLVSGSSVALQWTGSTGATQYRIEAGSQPGAANLVQFDTGSAQTSFLASNVPNGTYYVRVRAIGPGGVSGPSNELVITVGCTGPPPAPTGFTYTTSGLSVLLTWSASANLTSLIVNVGSSPGASNLAIATLAPNAVELAATAPPGTYYVRLRAANGCGSTPAANELVITVP
jgi:glucose/arabinose dehydrogenase